MERDILGHARARFLPSPTGRGGTARPAHWRDILVGRPVPRAPHDLSAHRVVANRNQLRWAARSFGTPGRASRRRLLAEAERRALPIGGTERPTGETISGRPPSADRCRRDFYRHTLHRLAPPLARTYSREETQAGMRQLLVHKGGSRNR